VVEKLSNTELADERKLDCFVDFWFGMLAMLFHTTRNLEYEWYVEHFGSDQVQYFRDALHTIGHILRDFVLSYNYCVSALSIHIEPNTL